MSNEDNYRGKNKLNRNKKKKKNGILKKIMKIFLILFLLATLIIIGLGIGCVYSVINGAGELSKADFEISKFTTYIYDKNGDIYATLNSGENRTYASISEISPYLPKAFIAIEDERFKEHFGIDIKRTTGATIKWLLSKLGIGSASYGGSTITQQVIKKVTGEEDRSWDRKAREIIRAIQLEQWLSKNQIIELYMNLIYLGEGSYGVETAAYTYFNKSADELTIAECALIAGLAQAPEGRNPYKYPEKAKSRQELVLGKMLELEYITQEEYDEAINQELVYTKGKAQSTTTNSYFVDAVIEDVIAAIQEEKGVVRVMAEKILYNNGLKIYTTVDPEIQAILEEVYTDESYFKGKNGEVDEELQSAMVIIDYEKGNVVGLVGGAGEKDTLRGLNRATQITRQPGSNIKPLAVYGPGLELGVMTAATVYDDIPLTMKVGNKTWKPTNYDGRYRGLTNIRKGIEVSMNVLAVKAFNDVGIDYSINFLEKLGISTLVTDKTSPNNDRTPAALALGGLTKGVSPLELAAAYGTIANGGVYVKPKLYTEVLDRNGEVVVENVSVVRDVMSQENAYILTNMLQEVTVGSEGTARVTKIDGIDTAGKTGTTSDSYDRWYTAYTPYYVGSVWVGYDQQKRIDVGVNPSARLWKAVMEKVHADLPNASFTKPSGVVTVEVCKDSGLLATELCTHDKRGSRVYSEYFNSKNGTIPTKYCTTHVYAEVCPDTFMLANPTCIDKVGTIEIVRINPDRLNADGTVIVAEDTKYCVPTTYCTFEEHYCPQDENGNWIVENDPIIEDIPTNDDENNDDENEENQEDDNSGGLFWWR